MDAYALYRRIVKCINNEEIESVIFTKIKEENIAGKLWVLSPPKRAMIEIDAKKGDALELFVHEIIHFLYPQFGEMRVRKWTRWWLGNASWRSKVVLLRFLLKFSNY